MQKALLVKAALIGILALLLMVPLQMIGGIVFERQQRHGEVVREIAASYAGEQRIAGPVLVIPYVEEYLEAQTDNAGRKTGEVLRRRDGAVYLYPKDLSVSGRLATDVKRRGLFKALVYRWEGTLAGSFRIPETLPIRRRHEASIITPGAPLLSVGISDPRGLSGAPLLEWNGARPTFLQGSAIAALPNGIHAPLPASGAGSVAFSLALGLRGTERIAFVPLADDTRVDLAADWPHPSFGGRFLPDPQGQRIDESGFAAKWHITALASSARQMFDAATERRDNCVNGACLESLDVRLVEPVNIYAQAGRSLKYGFLFIGLTFAAFLLFELLKGLRMHPAQYLLVGLALAMFFLLVISLSEHIEFWRAYLAATVACVALQGYYLGKALGNARRGAAFAALLTLLYGALYGLLSSEDNALVLGSLLLFALLAAAMVATRNFDWYRLAPAGRETASEAS